MRRLDSQFLLCQWSWAIMALFWASKMKLLDPLFLFLLKKYLFIFGSVFSTWDLSLQRTASLYFWCVGSTDAPGHVGILLPWPGVKPTSPALEGRFLTTGPPGKSRPLFLNRGELWRHQGRSSKVEFLFCFFAVFPKFRDVPGTG